MYDDLYIHSTHTQSPYLLRNIQKLNSIRDISFGCNIANLVEYSSYLCIIHVCDGTLESPRMKVTFIYCIGIVTQSRVHSLRLTTLNKNQHFSMVHWIRACRHTSTNIFLICHHSIDTFLGTGIFARLLCSCLFSAAQ